METKKAQVAVIPFAVQQVDVRVLPSPIGPVVPLATLDNAVLDNTIADELRSHVPNYNSLPMAQFQTFHRIINEVTAYVRKHAQELTK